MCFNVFFNVIFASFDSNKIKLLIDYALKPPSVTEEINIEKINLDSGYVGNMSKSENNSYLKAYKYPYVASEILSHDYPFIISKLISSNIFTSNNNCEFIGELSVINNSVGEEADQDIMVDDSLEENIQNIKRDASLHFKEDLENIDNCNNNTSFGNLIDVNFMENNNFELIDYMFNIGFNFDLTPVQGGYFIKIVSSLIHSLYDQTKSLLLIRYICTKKRSDLLSRILSNIHKYYFQEILLDLLLFSEEDQGIQSSNNINNNSSQNNINSNTNLPILDMIKSNILTGLITPLKNNVYGVSNIFCEFTLNCKSEDGILNESFLTKFVAAFNGSSEERALENFCLVSSHIIRQYKSENYITNNISNSKVITGLNIYKSPSPSKNILEKADKNSVLNNLNTSFNIINMPDSELIVAKFNSVIKNLNLSVFKSTSCKITLVQFIIDFMTITRGKDLLENLQSINFSQFLKEFFFESENDIAQNCYVNIVYLLVEEGNDKWINYFLVSNEFINDSISYLKQKSPGQHFIHILKIFEALKSNPNICDVLKSCKKYDSFNKCFQENLKDYIDSLENPLFEIKSDSFHLSLIFNKSLEGENDLNKVDEVCKNFDEKIDLSNFKNIRKILDVNRINSSLVKKNSFSPNLAAIKENFFGEQPGEQTEENDDGEVISDVEVDGGGEGEHDDNLYENIIEINEGDFSKDNLGSAGNVSNVSKENISKSGINLSVNKTSNSK